MSRGGMHNDIHNACIQYPTLGAHTSFNQKGKIGHTEYPPRGGIATEEALTIFSFKEKKSECCHAAWLPHRNKST